MKVFAVVLAIAAQTITPATPAVAKAMAGRQAKAELDLAVGRVPRYAPDKFAALPPTVREALNAAGCRVPQMSVTASPQNVISGAFAANGQRDWAALCSDGTNSQVVMVWGGAARCEDRLSALQDSDVMVQTAPAVLAFGRTIDVATIEQVNRSLVRFGQKLGETPSHDAIADKSAKASAIYYCRSGRWVTLPAA